MIFLQEGDQAVTITFMENLTNGAAAINVLHPGAAPVALSLARLAGIRETIDQFTGWSPNSRSTSPGILAETLVTAILCGCRPLYKVERFWDNKALEIFYKNDKISMDQLNDDAYARMLDKLSNVDCPRMFETICLNMLQHHSLDITLTHSDTTSVSVEGLYDTEAAGGTDQGKEKPFEITYGHSKDHRPDLKQLKLGLSVQQEGLPLSGELLSGNKSDQVWNPQAVQGLSELLQNQGYEKVIFLADCALISTETLQRLAQQKIQFISRLPETFGIAEELKEEVWKNPQNWEDFGALVEKVTDKTAIYKGWKTTREIGGESFVFVVVHSSKLEQRKERSLAKAVERTQQSLRHQGAELQKQSYACAPDAEQAGEQLMKLAKSKGFESEMILKKVEVATYGHKGRPKREEKAEIRTSWNVEVKIGDMNTEILEEKKRRESTFVLVSRTSEEMEAKEIMKSYKNQDKVERGFKFLKQPQYLGPVYTKKPKRVEALGYIFLLVLLLAKYLEYRVRVSLAQSGEVLKVGGQKVPRPSAKTIMEILDMVLVLYVSGHLVLPENVYQDALRMIRWAGFEESVYTTGETVDIFNKEASVGFSSTG
jgi:transposase